MGDIPPDPWAVQSKRRRLRSPSPAAVNTTTLCRRCSHVDLLAVFHGTGKHVVTHQKSVGAAFKQTNCDICQLVYHSIAKANPGYTRDELMDPNLTYTIRPKQLEAKDRPRLSELVDYWQVEIRCSLPQNYRKMTYPESPGAFDLIGSGSNNRHGSKRHFMKRRLMRKTFNVDHLATWLATCDRCHNQNSISSTKDSASALHHLIQSKRLRLIDVREKKIVVAPEKCRFFALSYVWGHSASHTGRYSPYEAATSSNATAARTRNAWQIDWTRIPRTIEEAAALVENLQERYLWVDALCIDQHDREDQETLIAAMDTIYENAYLTIVAASGNDANSGLARLGLANVGDADIADYDTAAVRTTRGELNLISSRVDNAASLLEKSKWNSRGWTYQEFVLSRRAVCFTEQEVFFTCEDEVFREAYTLVSDDSIAPSNEVTLVSEKDLSVHQVLMGGKSVSFDTYCKAVSAYTERELSDIRDRLNAFAGILHRTETLQSKDYLYTFNGLPSQWFYEALMWSTWRNPAPAQLRLDTSNTRIPPSWSWAGWTGEVNYPLRFYRPRNPLRIEAPDHYNIVGSPVEANFWWKDWPSPPTLYTGSTPSYTVLHLFAPVFHCNVAQDRYRSHEVEHLGVFARDTTNGADQVRLGRTPRYTLNGIHLSDKAPTADVLVLPPEDEPKIIYDKAYWRVFGIIFEKHGDLARRVGSLQIEWEYKGALTGLERYISREYVRLC